MINRRRNIYTVLLTTGTPVTGTVQELYKLTAGMENPPSIEAFRKRLRTWVKVHEGDMPSTELCRESRYSDRGWTVLQIGSMKYYCRRKGNNLEKKKAAETQKKVSDNSIQQQGEFRDYMPPRDTYFRKNSLDGWPRLKAMLENRDVQ